MMTVTAAAGPIYMYIYIYIYTKRRDSLDFARLFAGFTCTKDPC